MNDVGMGVKRFGRICLTWSMSNYLDKVTNRCLNGVDVRVLRGGGNGVDKL